uniref:Superoxide dismutase copper/zinc binding domain-containing protein n=1 Tax=Timema bartmani TaxID=61472 RepID=A0A7R9F8V9_9NEOP|nr:unnamed protein product [Timema bartmani]
MRDAIPVEERMIATLRFLATGRSLEDRFNMRLFLLSLFIAFVAAEERRAVVYLSDPQGKNPGNVGNVTFVQTDSGAVTVTGAILGLNTGKHGFHIHEKGDITGGCMSAGGHFNPEKKNHGSPNDTERHVGDLGNIEAVSDVITNVQLTDSLISLTGPHSIVGRAVVVHSDEDDLGKGGFTDSLTTETRGQPSGVRRHRHPVIPSSLSDSTGGAPCHPLDDQRGVSRDRDMDHSFPVHRSSQPLLDHNLGRWGTPRSSSC